MSGIGIKPFLLAAANPLPTILAPRSTSPSQPVWLNRGLACYSKSYSSLKALLRKSWCRILVQTLIARHCHRHDHHQKVILAITNIFYFKSPYSIPASFVTTPCQGHQAIKQVQAKNSELQVSLRQFLLTPGHLDRLARLGGFLTSVRNLRHSRGHPPSHRHGRLVLHHIQEVIQLPNIPVVVSEKGKYCRFYSGRL